MNGYTQVGAAPNDGIVTMLTINPASPYDVRDQHGSGSSDYPEEVITWLREVVAEVDVPVMGNVWWATPCPQPPYLASDGNEPFRNLKDTEVMSEGDISTITPTSSVAHSETY